MEEAHKQWDPTLALKSKADVTKSVGGINGRTRTEALKNFLKKVSLCMRAITVFWTLFFPSGEGGPAARR